MVTTTLRLVERRLQHASQLFVNSAELFHCTFLDGERSLLERGDDILPVRLIQHLVPEYGRLVVVRIVSVVMAGHIATDVEGGLQVFVTSILRTASVSSFSFKHPSPFTTHRWAVE